MNKNNIIGFVLIALVLIGFSWYSQPSEEERRAAFVSDSIQQASRRLAEEQAKETAQRKAATAQALALADTAALFHQAMQGEAQRVVLKNDKVELTFNSKGATVEKAVIKDYVGHDIHQKDGSKDTPDLTLFEGNEQSLCFLLAAKEANVNTADLYF